MDLRFVQNLPNLVLNYFNLVFLSTPDSNFFLKGKMNICKELETQASVVGAWGRKRNLIWMGQWKVGVICL